MPTTLRLSCLAALLAFAASASAAAPPAQINPYQDVLITVQEANTGSLLFGLGVNSDTGLTGSVILNERNFDLLRVPGCSTFRGAGQEFRIEAIPGTQLQRYGTSFPQR